MRDSESEWCSFNASSSDFWSKENWSVVAGNTDSINLTQSKCSYFSFNSLNNKLFTRQNSIKPLLLLLLFYLLNQRSWLDEADVSTSRWRNSASSLWLVTTVIKFPARGFLSDRDQWGSVCPLVVVRPSVRPSCPDSQSEAKVSSPTKTTGNSN